MRKVAVLGFGAAGYHGACGIRTTDPAAAIDVFTNTQRGPHNPMLTTYYVKHAIPYEAMFPYGTLEEAESALDLRIFRRAHVLRLDVANKMVYTSAGQSGPYDSILIATGASAFLPELPGIELPGVLAMRSEEDAVWLKERLDSGAIRSGLVFGASWSGIKVAEDFAERGIPCVLMNRSPQPLSHALFPQTAEKVLSHFQEKGITLALGKTLSHIQRASGGGLIAMTGEGQPFQADVIVVTSGIRPNLDFLPPDTPAVRQGILVNSRMESSVPGIYAAGDCCAALDIFSGTQKNIALWRNAVEQGRAAGINMAGGKARVGGNLPVSLGHCMGLDFMSVGDASCVAPSDEMYTYTGPNLYLCAARRGRALRCINMLGAVGAAGMIKNLFIKSIESPGAGLSRQDLCLARSQGLPDAFIKFLGGTL